MLLSGSEKADTLTSGADGDTLYGYGGGDRLVGNGGDDVLAGMAGNDTLLGGDGEDYLMGGAGSDTLDGGAGADWAAYEDAASGVTVSLAITTTQNTGGGGADKLTAIENLYGSAFNDVLTGDAGANTLAGDAGHDALSGGAGDDALLGGSGQDSLLGGQGDDWIVGGAGNDTIDGGAGVDWAAYDDATTGVTVDLNLTAAQNTGGGGVDRLVGVENVYGSAFNDVLTGDASNNTLAGDAGDDTLSGGAGDDFLVGGLGRDVINGGDGFDIISYDDGRSFGLQIDLEYGTAGIPAQGARPEVEGDRLVSIEGAIGSSYGDSITGDARDNYLFGGSGNDFLSGGGGADVVDGGDGNDGIYIKGPSFGAGGRGNDSLSADWKGGTLDGGEGDDSLSVDYNFYSGGGAQNVINGGEGTDTFGPYLDLSDFSIDLNISSEQSISGQENWAGLYVTLNSIENLKGGWGSDVLIGDAGANRLEGGEGFDTLSGGAGMDTLIGGIGKDIMTGGEGKDTFVFAARDSLFYSPDGTFDVITDFTAQDELRFSDAPAGFSYVESSAGSFVSALATVNSMLTGPSTFHEYIAFQVGADVYVFSGHADPGGAGLENIIKLAGVNLDVISYDSFL